MKILIYSGTSRQNNYTQHVANFVLQTVNKLPRVQAELVTPKSLKINFQNEGMEANFPELRQKVIAADAFILVAPEYNHSFPASLKYMLDLNLKEYLHKPVSFVGVSAGPFGGARMIESLVNIVRELGLVATFTDTNVSQVQDEIENKKFKDPTKWEHRINKMLKELLWMATALKTACKQKF